MQAAIIWSFILQGTAARALATKRQRAALEQQAPASRQPAFLLNSRQMDVAEKRLSEATEHGHMPKGWTSTNVRHCFSNPGWLKQHEWILLAGPLGKYALQGLLPAALEAPLFAYLDLLTQLGAKEISAGSVSHLQENAAIALTQMELHFPAWELDINRHMIIHLPEHIVSKGPPMGMVNVGV